jgi:hypothetical protein
MVEQAQVSVMGDCHVSSTSPNRQADDLLLAEMVRKGNRIQDGGQIKREQDIYHHGPRPISIICHLPDPPCFSQVTTFNIFSFSLPNEGINSYLPLSTDDPGILVTQTCEYSKFDYVVVKTVCSVSEPDRLVKSVSS